MPVAKKEKPPPKKRGRKPKKKTNEKKPPPKKRGRKPKGGKIVKKENCIIKPVEKMQQNIILHLKCNSSELNNKNKQNLTYNPDINEPVSFNLNNGGKSTELKYEIIKDNNMQSNLNTQVKSQPNINTHSNLDSIITKKEKNTKSDIANIKNIWVKLENLSQNLRTNNISDKCSACFWCTYDFDNPTIYIPKQYNEKYLEVYGCFCSPQCALSYLKNERIDDSTKWERNALLNNVYSKIFDYKRNIKPAPSPYYTLDKYFGNLNINEYRKLLTNDRVLLIVNKPMTKIMPEIYEENNDMPDIYTNNLNKKNIHSKNTKFRLKRSQEKKLKKNALTNNFNL
jgi:hypothetical protein